MDFLGGLRKLLGIDGAQKTPNVYRPQEDDVIVQTQRGELPLTDVNRGEQWQRMPGIPQFNRRGFGDMAKQKYEQAIDAGDLNSPYVLNVDPAQFGYPEDRTVQAAPQPWNDNGIGSALGRGVQKRFPSFDEILRRR